MFKYVILTILLVFFALGAIYFFVGVPTVYPREHLKENVPHRFGDPEYSIENIHVYVVYFAPRDKSPEQGGAWKELLVKSLETLKRFHALQLRGTSKISYTIYPEPMVGKEESLFYDGEELSAGNTHALNTISREVEERVFKNTGDLYRSDFFKRTAEGYPVLFILYEGVGASGGVVHESDLETEKEFSEQAGVTESRVFITGTELVEGLALVNKMLLAEHGASIFGHEFYHTFGAPDRYRASHEGPVSQSIMGSGRFGSIEKTFLEKETLKNFGL